MPADESRKRPSLAQHCRRPPQEQATQRRLADWQLPEGVDRALWDYINDLSIAKDYDEFFSQTNLLEVDQHFLTKHFHEPGRLLDLGCGTGRLLVHFSQRGLQVVGIDLSQRMLQVAAEKRDRFGLQFDLVQANICRLNAFRSGQFDYACCMFSTLGMVVGTRERDCALAETYRILRPGGLFGLHLHNLWYNLTDPQGRRWLTKDLLGRLVRSASGGEKIMPSYRGIPGLRLHVFTLPEIKRLLRRAGFELVEILPLSPSRRTRLAVSAFLGSFRANGWLLMFRKPA